MELTKEHFDTGLNLLQKDILENIATQTVELKNYVRESFEIQQIWMDERFKELIVAYDVRNRVFELEKDVAVLKLDRPLHN